MQFKNFALLASASAAAALPASNPQTPSADDKFGLIAIHSGSAVHNLGITAGNSAILAGGKQNATCDSPSDYATFYIKDTALFLYAASATPQEFFVDRSGMGQGITRYTTGAQPASRNGERTPWSIDEDSHLVFDGMSPQACPTGLETGGYSIWFSDLENPGYNQNCTGIALRAIKATDPVSCFYSE